MLNALPQAKSLTGDRGYDSDWFRKKEPQSPAPLQRGAIQKAPRKIENSFGWLKDSRAGLQRVTIAAPAHLRSSICIAASLISYLR